MITFDLKKMFPFIQRHPAPLIPLVYSPEMVKYPSESEDLNVRRSKKFRNNTNHYISDFLELKKWVLYRVL